LSLFDINSTVSGHIYYRSTTCRAFQPNKNDFYLNINKSSGKSLICLIPTRVPVSTVIWARTLRKASTSLRGTQNYRRRTLKYIKFE